MRIGTGCGQWHAQVTAKIADQGVIRHADGNRRTTRSHHGGDNGSFSQDQAEAARPKLLGKLPG